MERSDWLTRLRVLVSAGMVEAFTDPERDPLQAEFYTDASQNAWVLRTRRSMMEVICVQMYQER